MTTAYKRALVAIAVILVALVGAVCFLAGLNAAAQKPTAGVVQLPDGSEVMCVMADNGGVSCNWLDVGM